MCGFVGFSGGNCTTNEVGPVMSLMLKEITTRGPDSSGQWSDYEAGIHLGHQRLSILDLSPQGHQPMASISGRYVITYNGEIYNHLELRLELEKKNDNVKWKGSSDTETLLNCIEIWGIEKTCSKLKGMFAFGVWDKTTQVLSLVRDRIGEKPLYYGWQGKGCNRVFLFGSDLRAFKPHPQFKPNVNRDSLSLLLRHNYIPAPYCIYEGFSKLEPGWIMKISLKTGEQSRIQYWNAQKIAIDGKLNPFEGSYDDALSHSEKLITSAIKGQMLSDVPIGAFLSGGIDSSLIVALMQSVSDKPVKTFTIGFKEKGFNEAEFAQEVASVLSTDHTELYVTPDQCIDVIAKVPSIYGEPFADSSQIPTFLVSALAKRDITVALSGDGGDELFCGYNRYNIADNFWRKIRFIPPMARKKIAKLLLNMPSNLWDSLGSIFISSPSVNLSDKISKGCKILGSSSVDDIYYNLISICNDPTVFLINSFEPVTQVTKNNTHLDVLNSKERMMLLDLVSYLPDDILTKVDRASMGVSLETRVPFLDSEVVESAFHMPLNYKIKGGKSKSILRDILFKYVPKNLIERPKMGFGVPLDQWLRGTLRPWAEEMLSVSRLSREGFFDVDMVRSLWQGHLSGQTNSAAQLWAILMFQAWLLEQ
ncbi:asparagine synthase (glutamine-hydrolyzing) [Porticoccaceae bacterium]|nr:asparagine synthase (glutamine-hydrolyzing) [Porticoccaceae bacterium]